jgi:hypothetical protein
MAALFCSGLGAHNGDTDSGCCRIDGRLLDALACVPTGNDDIRRFFGQAAVELTFRPSVLETMLYSMISPSDTTAGQHISSRRPFKRGERQHGGSPCIMM